MKQNKTSSKMKIIKIFWSVEKRLEYLISGKYAESFMVDVPNKKVAIVATMSAGKSTLINAMLGNTVLPFKNQACTAKCMVIQSNPMFLSPVGVGYGDNGLVCKSNELTMDKLTEWNDLKEIERIEVYCQLPNLLIFVV